MQNMEEKILEIEGLRIEPFELSSGVSKFDLTLTAKEDEKNLHFDLEYSTRIFKQETMERFFKHYKNILKQVVENLKIQIHQIELLDGEERQQILDDFNQTKIKYPRVKMIHQLFEEAVERTPHEVALVFEKQEMTYAQFNKKANQLARNLVEKGVTADSIVAIVAERSFEMVIGIMAILKAGAGYLPISPEYPVERMAYMVTDSEAKIILTQGKFKEKIVSIDFNGEVMALEEEKCYQGEGSNLNLGDPQHLSYILVFLMK